MPVDATGTTTTPDGIPTYTTGADAPSGKGLNNIITTLQSILTANYLRKPWTAGDGDFPVWDSGTSTWKRSSTDSKRPAPAGLGSGTPSASTFLRGDGAWSPPQQGAVIADTTSPGASWDTNTILGGNIPSVYNHLRIVLVGRTTAAVTTENCQMQWNADVGADYYDVEQQSTGTAGTVGEGVGTTSFQNFAALIGTSAGLAPEATLADISIPFYKDTTFYKQFLATAGGLWAGTSGQHFYRATEGMWINTAAITRIKLFPATGSFAAGTRIILYGIM